jgi:hypothetical protein
VATAATRVEVLLDLLQVMAHEAHAMALDIVAHTVCLPFEAIVVRIVQLQLSCILYIPDLSGCNCLCYEKRAHRSEAV